MTTALCGEKEPKALSPEHSTRRRIVTGARRYFFANGIRGVSMDDLARELGMSKKTLYTHFPGKAAIVEAAIEDKISEVESEMAEISSGSSEDFPGSIRRLFACVLRQMAEIQPPFMRDILREAPEAFKLIEVRRKEMIQRHIGKLLAEGGRAGIIRKDIPVELIIEIFLGAVQRIMNPPRLSELGLTPESGFSAILGVVFEGAVTEEGRSRLWPTRA